MCPGVVSFNDAYFVAVYLTSYSYDMCDKKQACYYIFLASAPGGLVCRKHPSPHLMMWVLRYVSAVFVSFSLALDMNIEWTIDIMLFHKRMKLGMRNI